MMMMMMTSATAAYEMPRAVPVLSIALAHIAYV